MATQPMSIGDHIMVLNEIAEITLRSLTISFSAMILASLWSIPLALYLSRDSSKAVNIVVGLFNSLVGVPTVVVGLFFYMLFSRSGPLGFIDILYSPIAIAIGEAFLITPWIVSLGYELFRSARQSYWELAISLGIDEDVARIIMIKEVWPDLLVVLLMAFSRAVGELGVALLIGGNIKGATRVLTTTIALAVSRGEFEFALTLGGMLILILFLISLMIRMLKVYKE